MTSDQGRLLTRAGGGGTGGELIKFRPFVSWCFVVSGVRGPLSRTLAQVGPLYSVRSPDPQETPADFLTFPPGPLGSQHYV